MRRDIPPNVYIGGPYGSPAIDGDTDLRINWGESFVRCDAASWNHILGILRPKLQAILDRPHRDAVLEMVREMNAMIRAELLKMFESGDLYCHETDFTWRIGTAQHHHDCAKPAGKACEHVLEKVSRQPTEGEAVTLDEAKNIYTLQQSLKEQIAHLKAQLAPIEKQLLDFVRDNPKAIPLRIQIQTKRYYPLPAALRVLREYGVAELDQLGNADNAAISRLVKGKPELRAALDAVGTVKTYEQLMPLKREKKKEKTKQ